MASDLPLLPTSTTGAYCVPSWLQASREPMRAGAFGTFDIQETFDDAVLVALDDQLRAGIDVVTDGEMRRLDFIMGFYERLENVRPAAPFRKIGFPFYDAVTLYETTGQVRAPQGLGCVEEVQFLRRLTDRPVKVAVPGPLTLLTPLVVREGYARPDDLVDDLAAIVRRELVRLQDSGCAVVQIDEPAFHDYFARDLGRVTRLFNDLVAGLRLKIALHVCFGNYAGRPRSRRSYRPLLPFLREAQAYPAGPGICQSRDGGDRAVARVRRRPRARLRGGRSEVVLPRVAAGGGRAGAARPALRGPRQAVAEPRLRHAVHSALDRAGQTTRAGRGRPVGAPRAGRLGIAAAAHGARAV
jgi:5-methyltetrahydropteroyltriglutamate--homocysteine methyltransferase